MARFNGRPKPPSSAKTERKLHALIDTPFLGSYYSRSSGAGTRYDRYLAFQLVLANNTQRPVTVNQTDLSLRTEEKSYKIETIPQQAGYQSFRVDGNYHQLRSLKLIEKLTVPPGKTATGWVAFTGISPGSTVPKLLLEVNAEGNRTELNINDYTLGMLDLKVEQIGPRNALALLTISGSLNSVNLGNITSILEKLKEDHVARAVIRWTEKAEELDSNLLNWMKQAAALAGTGNTINNPQMPTIAPASIREFHLAQIPNYKSRTSSSSTTRVYSPYGGSIQVNLEANVHEQDIDAVGAALESAFRNLPADEVIREIESGHPLTRAAALAGGGGRLPEEKIPVLLKYADHKDPRFQHAALIALGHFGTKEAIGRLIEATRSGDKDLAAVATESLAASRYSAAHQALLEVLKSKKSPAREVIIGALARHPRPLWSDTIYEIASELDSETGAVALQALARVGHPRRFGLFEKALQHSDSKVREAAFNLLLAQPNPECEELAMDYTLNQLKESPPTSPMYSLLSRVKDPRAVPMLLKHFRETKGENSQVVNLLAQIGDQTVADVFVEMYPELKQTSSKSTVLNALQQLQSPKFRELAGKALLEKDTSLVSTASRTLQADGSPEAVRLLIEGFEKSENSSTWSYTSNVLSRVGTPEARAALIKARDSGNEQKKKLAMSALRNLQRRSPGYQYLYQGDNFRKQEDWDNAINYYSIAVKIDSQLAGAYTGRGLAYIRKGGKPKEARADFLKAEDLDPYDFQAVSYSALLTADDGKVRASIKKMEEARERFADHNGYAFHLARVYGKAVQWLEKNPENLPKETQRKQIESFRNKSMEEFQRAFKLGFDNKTWAANNRDLIPIRDLPEYKKLLGPAADAKSKPKSKKKKAKPAKARPAAPAAVKNR